MCNKQQDFRGSNRRNWAFLALEWQGNCLIAFHKCRTAWVISLNTHVWLFCMEVSLPTCMELHLHWAKVSRRFSTDGILLAGTNLIATGWVWGAPDEGGCICFIRNGAPEAVCQDVLIVPPCDVNPVKIQRVIPLLWVWFVKKVPCSQYVPFLSFFLLFTLSLSLCLLSASLSSTPYFYACKCSLFLSAMYSIPSIIPSLLCISFRFRSFSSQKRINRPFETMFETGVDEMSWDDTVRNWY